MYLLLQGQIFESFSIKSEASLEEELKKLSEQKIINFSSFFPLHNPILFYKLHSFISEVIKIIDLKIVILIKY